MFAQSQPASPLAGNSNDHYQRHQPEHTLLYRLVERHYPTFNYLMAKTERPLSDFVQQEFEAYLKCGHCSGSAIACVPFANLPNRHKHSFIATNLKTSLND
jgi:hypothetical protein